MDFHYKVVDYERGAAEAEISRRLSDFATREGTPHVFIRYESAAVWDPCPREPPEWKPQPPRVRMILVSKEVGLPIYDLIQQPPPIVTFSAEQLVKGYIDLILALAQVSGQVQRPYLDEENSEKTGPHKYRFWHNDSHRDNLVVSPTDGHFCLIDFGRSVLVWTENGKLHKIDPRHSEEKEVASPKKTVQIAWEVFTSLALRVPRDQPWYDFAVRIHDLQAHDLPRYCCSKMRRVSMVCRFCQCQ
jgi:hypothetical protein